MMTTESTPIAGRYQLGQFVGGGGMGDVYTGTDTLTGETVAIKKLRAGGAGDITQMIERFTREGEALRRLNHPNIVKVLAAIHEEPQHFLVMEFVPGGSLADLLFRQPQLPVEQVVSIGLELSDALSRAHHLNILHRDIKPANILLAEDGTPRLTDFGLARLGELSRMTESHSILGTYSYLSPEAFEGQEVNGRSDIWSFGVVLFEMLVGRLPFRGDTPFEIMWAVKNNPLPILENSRNDLPAPLANLIRRMLRKDNPARVESARQVGVELESIQKALRNAEKGGGKSQTDETTSPIIRVLIADDHAVVRQGLRMFIDLQEDMQVIGEGVNGRDAIDLARKLNPDIVLLDLVMPEIDGVEATSRIKEACPQARVIILTSFGEDNKVIPAIRAGAQSYLLKDIRPEELVEAVRETYQGKTRLHPDIATKLMSIVARNNQPAERPASAQDLSEEVP